MTTYKLPPEPPVGTRLVDKQGRTWTQERAGWWAASGAAPRDWGAVLRFGPLTDIPAPALPTENGALIIASGVSGGETFENKVLVLLDGEWHGQVHCGFVHPEEITPWTEAVAVPKAEFEALREAVRDLASIGPHSSSVTPRFTVVNLAFELVNAAVDGAS